MIKPFRERNEKLIRVSFQMFVFKEKIEIQENAQIEVNNRECRESVAKAYALNEEVTHLIFLDKHKQY